MNKTTTIYIKFLACIAVILAPVFTISSSMADEGIIRAKLSYGFASYASPFGNNQVTSNYSTQGLGVTYIWPSNVFVDLNTKISGKDALYNAKVIFPGLVTRDQEFIRTENTLTIGKPTENGTQLNIGIFTASTVFNLEQNGQFSQIMSGLTTGAGKGFLIDEGRSGTIGVSGTLALLNAKNTDRFGLVSNSNLSFGVSLGTVYSFPLSKSVSVLADAKFQTYFIKYPTFSGDERILSTSLSLLGQF